MIEQEKVGEFLKSLRKAKGYTQQEVADALYVSPKSISRWESGDGLPDISIMTSVADLYGVTVDEILRGEKINGGETKNSETPKIKNAKNYLKLIKATVVKKYSRCFIASLIVLGSSILAAFILAFFGLGMLGLIFFICGMIAAVIINIVGKNNSNIDLDEFDEDEIPFVKEGIKNGQKQIQKNFMTFWDLFVASTLILAFYMLLFSKCYYFKDEVLPLVLPGYLTQWIVDVVCYTILLAVSYIPARVIFAKFEGKERYFKLEKALSWCFLTYIAYFLTMQFGVAQCDNASIGWDYNNLFSLLIFNNLYEQEPYRIVCLICTVFLLLPLALVSRGLKKPVMYVITYSSCVIGLIIWMFILFLANHGSYSYVLIFDVFALICVFIEIAILVLGFILHKKVKQIKSLEKANQ